MICKDCVYCYRKDDEDYARCYFEGLSGWAPCEQEEPTWEKECEGIPSEKFEENS